ncbi:hypothetical protein HNO89_000524 [Sporosarcina luteola]|nr:hypothetical protein [Sporosarcina luteola]
MRCKGIAMLLASVAVACSAFILISAHLMDDWAKAKFDLQYEASTASQEDQLDMEKYLAQWQAEMNYNGFTERQVKEGKEIVEEHMGKVELTSMNRE